MISTIKPNGRITITPIGGLRAEKLRSGELPHLLALLRRLQRHLAALQCVDPRERLLTVKAAHI